MELGQIRGKCCSFINNFDQNTKPADRAREHGIAATLGANRRNKNRVLIINIIKTIMITVMAMLLMIFIFE